MRHSRLISTGLMVVAGLFFLVGCGSDGDSLFVEEDLISSDGMVVGDSTLDTIAEDSTLDTVAEDDGVCTPDCEGKECGDDGCGGTCGSCPEAAPECNEMQKCQVQCVPDCEGKECGDDGCGGECGTCPDAAPVCNEMQKCQGECVANCDGKNCGDDGCGGTCGSCTGPSVCSSGHCSDPLCVDVDCGEHGSCDADKGYPLCACHEGYFNLGMVCAKSNSNYLWTGEFTITSNPETVAGNLSADVFDPIENMPVAFVIGWDLNYTDEDSCWGAGESSPCLQVAGFFSEFYLYGASQEIVNAYDVVGEELHFDLITEYGEPSFGGINFVTTPAPSGVFYGFEFKPFEWPLPLDGDYPVMGNVSADTNVSLRRYLSPSSMSDKADGTAHLEMHELSD